jgi:tetratricopeptide (TPR) repeat protein
MEAFNEGAREEEHHIRMARKQTVTSDDSPKGKVSGRRGGPATDGGVKYHDDYICLLILRLMQDELLDPLTERYIDAEPRVVGDRKGTAWDLGSQPRTVGEVKRNPTKEELLDFLTLAAKTHDPEQLRAYHFVYSDAKPFLKRMKKLLDLAKEAGGDTVAFEARLELEGREGTEEFLQAAGEAAPSLLCRMELVQVPEFQLEQLIQRTAAEVAGSLHAGEQLAGMLTRRILKAMSKRMRLHIGELLEEARRIGIPVPGAVVAQSPNLPTAALETFCILQAVPDPLPLCVTASAVGSRTVDLPIALASLMTAGFLTMEGGHLHRGSRTEKAVHPNMEDVLAQGLTALLDYISTTDEMETAQVRNARALAEACIQARPKAVAPLFDVLHSRLKNLGDKHQVFDIAWLTIRAARAVEKPCPPELLKCEARALICGVSWVLQRRGLLDQAWAHGQDSLKLGRDLRWQRNTSFCLKCLGRLRRMMAKEEKDAVTREEFSIQSLDYLTEAIRAFGPDAGEGANPAEEGDCWSLLGRTYLEMGRMEEARDAAERAHELIGHRKSKDSADLLILRGDLELSARRYDLAHDRFSEALEIQTTGDSRHTEIQARAHYRRGLNWERRNNPREAIADYKRAEAIWKELGERQPAADARWRIVLLEDRPETELLDQVADERSTVRLAVYEKRKRDLEPRSGKVLARRSAAPTQRYWDEIIAQARAADRGEESTW